jgi:hypothetical protein
MTRPQLDKLAAERRNDLFRQIVGLASSLAAAEGVTPEGYQDFLRSVFHRLSAEARADASQVRSALDQKIMALDVKFARG